MTLRNSLPKSGRGEVGGGGNGKMKTILPPIANSVAVPVNADKAIPNPLEAIFVIKIFVWAKIKLLRFVAVNLLLPFFSREGLGGCVVGGRKGTGLFFCQVNSFLFLLPSVQNNCR